MEPASGPLAKWNSTPEHQRGRSGKSLGTALNLSVLESLPPKEEGAPLTGSSSDESTPKAPRVKPLDFSKIDQFGKKPSPPRTLEIQRQRIMAKRALSLGNLHEAINPRSPKESPKDSPLTLSGELKKGGLLFDREFRAEMEKRLKEHRHTQIEREEIEKLANGYVHNVVDELFINEKHPEQFCLVTIRENLQLHSKLIHSHLINCQVLVSPLVERLKFLEAETIKYLNGKAKTTPLCDHFLQYLKLLINAHSLQAFLDIYRKDSWSETILILGEKACGPNMAACLEEWKKWLDPNKFHSLQSPFIHNLLDNMALTKLPGKRYSFPQTVNPRPILSSIGCYEVSRCLYNEGNPNYAGIVFVGKQINFLKRINLKETQDSEIEFFGQVFNYLHELGYLKSRVLKEAVAKNETPKEGSFYKDEELFMLFRKIDFKPLQTYLKEGGTDFTEMERLVGLSFVNSRVFAVLYNRHALNAENIIGLLPSYFIPSFYALQRGCLTSWSVGHEYFMQKFKHLFTNPFWSRLTSDLHIEFRKEGYVIQTKSYNTGKRVNENSHVFDEKFNPINFQFKWHVSENEPPFFELISITVPADVNWNDKWTIIRGVIETISDDNIHLRSITDRLAALGVK